MSDEEIAMFGMTKAEIVAERSSFYSLEMWAMSILSDVQEIIKNPTVDNLETARQWINKAKFWIQEATERKSKCN